MGLLGSLARRTGAAAMYGSGRLVSVVVPDSITPWNLRRTASHTSNSLLRLGLRELTKRKKKKRSTKNSAASAKRRKTSRPATRPGGSLLSWIWSKPGKSSSSKPTGVVLLSSGPTPRTTARPSVRASTTKGRASLSRKTAPAQVVAIIHQPVANEPRFDKNAWSSGRGLRSTTDWDTPSPAARATAQRRRSRVARSGGKFKTRKARR